MVYMVIEQFAAGKLKEVYKRFDERGRMIPEGVEYVNSWISEDLTTCYQVMKSVSEEKLMEWIHNWDDLVDFEVIPVILSAEAREKALRN